MGSASTNGWRTTGHVVVAHALVPDEVPLCAVQSPGVVSMQVAAATGRQQALGCGHGFGLQTRYGHLLNYTVKVGETVKRGDVIGHVGNTGRSTGYHLHYEVLANGKLLNPLQLLSQQNPRVQ